MGRVTGQLPQEKRSKVREQVAHAVDAWFDAAYVGGDYPRNDFADAWPGFTTGAQAEAQGDKALMSNQDIGADIAGVEATARKVTVDVLAVKGKPSGATARFVLKFRTDGDVQRKVEVRGRLFLTPGGRRLADLRLRRDEGAVGLMSRLRWVRRLVTLAAVLAVAALVVPDSAVKPTQMELVKINRATGVDYPSAHDKDVVWILAVGSDARPGEDMTRVAR